MENAREGEGESSRRMLRKEAENKANSTLLFSRWTFGSILFLTSFAVVMGPVAYAQHLLSTPRLPFTVAYFGSLALSLYFSLGVSHHSFAVTKLCYALAAQQGLL